MPDTDPSLLLLIPAYNEEARIGPVLDEFARYFRQHYHGPFQIVVVLNGCVDNTLGVVQQAATRFPEIRALDFPGRIGKGGALIEGLRLAPVADRIGYVDADGATSPAAFLALVRQCGPTDCVIGSRWLPGAVLHQAQTRMRRLASRIFHLIVQSLFWLNIKDTQCPAKVLTGHAARAIHSSLQIADLAFDVNLIVSLRKAGFSVREVPTEWTDKIGSKVTTNLMRTSLVMFLSVVRLRLVYSPFYNLLRPLRPLEAWIYQRLSAPPPRVTSPPAPAKAHSTPSHG